ncbi:MAG: type II secretion system protein GspM [Butyricicoccus sp.]|nr:type II secretion system protein GspM [Butyricicoccus sp.]
MRKLSIRERVLLVCLAVIAVISGYVLLFYMPLSQRTTSLQSQIAQSQKQYEQLQTQLTDLQQMEQLLDSPDALPAMPEYDNLQAVMIELHTVLASCQEYSLSFQENQTNTSVLNRQVTIPFTCGNYEQARTIVQRLHDNPLRSLLTDVQLSQQEDGTIKGTAILTFFEYREAESDETD